MYSNGFVVCVLIGGEDYHVAKEREDGTVLVQAGQEYFIRLHNKNNRRAVGKIFIDGKNVSDGGYVVNANSYVDIKRYLDEDRAFKVATLSSDESNENLLTGKYGVIEVRFRFEKKNEYIQQWNHPLLKSIVKSYPRAPSRSITMNCSMDASALLSFQDAKTEKGSATGQTFGSIHVDLEAAETIIKLTLKIPPKELIQQETYCVRCGKKYGRNDKFCAGCGNKR